MTADNQFQFLLEKIRRNKGADFSLYREGTVRRRIDARLRKTGCADYLEYVSYLNRNPEEYDRLIEEATINVTEFFRNPETFRAIQQKVLPAIIRDKSERSAKSIRAWCAGASYGEETYSLAILMLQVLRERIADYDVKILGTDIDPDCIAKAKIGLYEPSHLKAVSSNILDSYFSRDGGNYRVSGAVRRLAEFKTHNMLSDKLFRAWDLILCRNVVIYFMRPLQAYVCHRFVGCLKPGGFLVLGKMESLAESARDFFETIDNGERIYRKV